MFNLVKGTHDVILSEADKYTFIEQTFVEIAQAFNYKEFRTPIIEASELFQRSVGESSDIVRKEMYTFLDKGDRSITLRPELTAGTVRSIVNNKLLALGDFPIKAYYVGPCFRYERPQQGRYRQFNQFGIECIGINSPYRDVEVVSLAYYSLKMLGFKDLKLIVNCIGDDESRNNYKEVLRKYFESHLDEMCEDCKDRFKLNVLRILDCKVEHDQEIVKQAPKISDYLSENSKNNFNKFLKSLDDLEIEYEIDDSLVRGLDYYSDVVFEIHYTSSKGLNYGALCAGGHYNKLVQEIGGPNGVEGCGVAVGIERIAAVMNDDNLFEELDESIDCYVMPMNETYQKNAIDIGTSLRLNGFKTEVCLENKSFKAMFKKAIKLNARFAVIIGENEVNNNSIVVKDLTTEIQEEIALESLTGYLDMKMNEHGDEECDDPSCSCHHHHE